MTASLDEALAWIDEAPRRRSSRSRVGLVGNAAEVLPELVRRGVTPDVVTDQTSAHDTLNGYVPAGMSLAAALALRASRSRGVRRARDRVDRRARARDARAHAGRGAVTFDYGNNIRTVALDAGLADAFDIPGLRAGVHPAALLRGEGAVPLGRALGRSRGHLHRTDELVLELFPHDAHLARWITLAREKVHFQGLPARICWLGQGERAKFGVAINDLVASGEICGADRDRPRPPRHGQRRVARSARPRR